MIRFKNFTEFIDGESMNECLIVTGKLDNKLFIFKNRDRSFTPDTLIVREEYKGIEIVYYTDQTGRIEGMNEYGVTCVSSQLTLKEWEGYGQHYRVTDEPKKASSRRVKYKKYAHDILACKTAEAAIKVIEKMSKSGNYIVADAKDIYEIEIYKHEIKKRKLDNNLYVKTNHGVMIHDAGHSDTGKSTKRAASTIRKHQAEEQLIGVEKIDDIPNRMKIQVYDTNSPLNVFRTDREEYTISQCLFNLTDLEFNFFHDERTADTLKIEEREMKAEPKIKITVTRYRK